MNTVRIGIIGLGNMGAGHARTLLSGEAPELLLTAVADANEMRRNAILTLPGAAEVKAYASWEELVDTAPVDAVLIASPHYLHPVQGIRAFHKGLHVLCEKPAGVYAKAVRLMNDAALGSGKTFALMYNQRTNSLYRKMHEIVGSGELGEMKRTTWIVTDWYRSQSYYDSSAWRATWAGEGGGVLINQCSHNLDLWQWICGMPVKVHALCKEGLWHDIEVEDDVTAYVEYANGATGTLITSTGETPGANRFEVSLDGGKLLCENGKLFLYRLNMPEREFNRTYTGGFGKPECIMTEVETDGENLQHVGVMRAFAANILRGEPLVAEGCEGIRGLTLSNAMYLSSWLGMTVNLPLDEDLYFRLLKEKVEKGRKMADGRRSLFDAGLC